MWDKPVLLRPHHGLCLAHFVGEGYSGPFAENMGQVLSALTAAFAASHGDMFEAAASAAVFWGICGERAADRMKDGDGSGSFRAYLIDAVGTVSELDTDKMAKTQLYDLKEGARCI